MSYRITYSCVSHIGKLRKMNQDNFFCDGKFLNENSEAYNYPLKGVIPCDRPSMLGVFDGMGGEECGEIASLIAARCAADYSVSKKPLDSLREFCKLTNEKICTYAAENSISSMGTTAAILAFTKAGITLCNIGDSRIYRYADMKLEQISVDHYGVAAHGMKPPLSQNLGISPSVMVIEPYVAKGSYNDGDVYLICSDGLTDMVSSEAVLQILNETAFDAAANKLLAAALENGGKDNITIILCRIDRKKHSLFRRLLQDKKEKRR